jgi:hypothetical protein
MGVEDHQPAHQHDQHGNCIGPVPQAGGQPVPPDEIAALDLLWHRARLRFNSAELTSAAQDSQLRKTRRTRQ